MNIGPGIMFIVLGFICIFFPGFFNHGANLKVESMNRNRPFYRKIGICLIIVGAAQIIAEIVLLKK